LSQVHQPRKNCTDQVKNRVEVTPLSWLVHLRQVHPLQAPPAPRQHFSPSNPQPHHAPHYLPQPSFRHPHSVWSLASLVSARGGAVHHLSSCRLAPADQAAGTGTHARGIRTTRDEGGGVDGRGGTFGRYSGWVVDARIWRLCVEQCTVQTVC